MPLSKLYFEDFQPGHTTEYGPRLVTREEIIAFAAQYDPQPMHLDEAAGQKSLLGGLGASGWHSCGIMMRMICDGFMLNSASMGAGGVDEVQWLRPIRPGDRLTLARHRAGGAHLEKPAGDGHRPHPLRDVQRAMASA